MSEIRLKSAEEIKKIRRACCVVAEVLRQIGPVIKAGAICEDLDSIADRLIREQGAEPVFIGYRGYRHATCISINQEIVHGIPGRRALKIGDIVGFDVGAKLDGYCGDAAATYAVGKLSGKAKKLLQAGREALTAAIRQSRAGNHLGDISAAIERVANRHGFSVVRDLYGHGIGSELHEEPLIPNYGRPGEGPKLLPGMVLCLEPMLNVGGWKIKTLADGWTVVTEDGSLSCHYEHTVLITDGEPEILTKL
jgi:methionyl aminopeptidase